ncbi:MAG: PQQ-binding-like beta-propeller repeat protein [Verrucomicrobia bacterium]|nr:PQQ-binding-like beta-propeller repeat protein [Verrucomicrobiota bacterium]MCH8512468.1 PQQ-binding-like beta-propeller repeat protein [Kiritimatiellia bacterium]
MKRTISSRLFGILTALLLFSLSFSTHAAELADITAREGGDGGLVVFIEPADTALAQALAGTNRHLVVALSADPQRVSQLDDAFVQAGVYPVANAIHWINPELLPFQSNTVNILVLDRETGVRLGGEEVQRVLVPGHGFALADGQEMRKPRPEGMDTWLGWNRDATGNRMSRDTEFQIPNSIRWLTGPRTTGQHLVTDRVHYLEASFGGRYNYQHIYGREPMEGHARDAFSGVHLWKLRYDSSPGTLLWNKIIVSDGERLFLPADGAGQGRRGQPPRDMDFQVRNVVTGEVLTERLSTAPWAPRVRAGEIRTGDWNQNFAWSYRFITDGTRIYQADGGSTVRALSPDGGEVIWQKSLADGEYADMVATDGNVLALVIAKTDNFPAPSFRNFNRNNNIAKAIIGLDPATGEERWRYEGVNDAPLSFLVVDHGVVVAATHLVGSRQTRPGGSSMRSTPEVAAASLLVSLEASTGREHFKRAGNEGFANLNNRGDRASLNVRHDRIVYNESMFAISFDIRTGELLENFDWGTRVTGWSPATVNFLMNDARFRSIDGSVDENPGISASDYGSFHRVANGAYYIAGGFRTTSDRRSVGETMALAHEAQFPERLADDRRLLVRGTAQGVRAPSPGDWPTLRGDSARRGWVPADGPARLAPAWQTEIANLPEYDLGLKYDWEQNSQSPGILTQPVADAERVLVSVPDRHEIVCLGLSDGQERWRTRLGGRSAAPPTLAGDVAFVGVNDGTVSAIDLRDGSIIWTFFAAPFERYHNAHQQVESTHPVRSSPVLHNDTLYVAAGRHGKSDAGMVVWALDPATGAPRASTNITDRHVNDILQLVNDRLVVAYSQMNPASLEPAAGGGGPSISPMQRGHDGGHGWIGPAHLWRGYRVHGNETRDAGPAIQTDREFWRFTAGAFAEMHFDNVGDHKRVIRTGHERDFATRTGSNTSMQTYLAGAGNYLYAFARGGNNIRVSVCDVAAETQTLHNFEITQGREQIIPDGIAIAHGHVILTTTAGRVLAFRQP